MGLGPFGLLGQSNLHNPRTVAGGEYVKLFEVAVQHDYYNRHEDRSCFDFDIHPNSRTQSLMRQLGLIFRSYPGGFSVFRDTARDDTLYRHLTSTGLSTNLSFFLILKNPRFLNLTKIPFDLNPMAWNYCFRNDNIVTIEEHGARKTIFRQDEPIPVKPVRFPVFFPKNKESDVRIRTATGEIVELPPLYPFALGDSDISSAFVDLSMSSEEAYRLEGAAFRPEALAMKDEPNVMPNFIYSTGGPVPFGLIDILLGPLVANLANGNDVRPVCTFGATDRLRRPSPQAPVWLSNGTLDIPPQRYVLQFESRGTRWVYHIVPRSASTNIRTLAIENVGKEWGAIFEGPEMELNPRSIGPRGYRFTSTTALSFQEQSEIKLRLKGKLEGMDERVLLDRLPVASPDQVLRREASDPKGDNFSDIYVYV